jgi:hypothetical protein
MHVWLEISTWCNSATCTHQKLPRILQVPCSMHPEDVCEYHYINSGLHEPVYDYSSPAARALHQPRRAPRLLVSGRMRSTSTSPCAATTRLRPHALYVNLVVHREYSSSLSRLQRSTSTPPRVRVPRHVARLITRLVAPLVVDYSASPRLVVDYSTARPGASARRVARHAARRAAHRRLHRASGCLGTSRGSSRGSSHRSSSTTSPSPRVRVPRHVARLVFDNSALHRLVVDFSASRTLVVDNSASRRLVVDYFASAARPGSSARRAARRADRQTARRRLLRAPRLRLAATLALLQPRRALRLLVSRQHWLYFEYAARRRDVVFRSHRVDHSS